MADRNRTAICRAQKLRLTRADRMKCKAWLAVLNQVLQVRLNGDSALARLVLSPCKHVGEQRDALLMLVDGRLAEFSAWEACRV
jgi:hypothetical protein